MKCPAPERLAELAGEGSDDEDLLAHLADCADCRALVDAQREVRDWLAEPAPARTPELPRSHREALAAEVLARADMLAPAPGRRAWRWGAVAMAAAAAVAVGLLAWPRGQAADVPLQPAAREPAAIEHIAMAVPDEALHPHEARPDEPAEPRARVEGTGEFSRAGDVVTLAAGDVTIDARRSKAISIVSGDTSVRARAAKVKVVAVRGAISQVSVFAGSAEISLEGKTVIVEQGMTWSRPEVADVDVTDDAADDAADGAAEFRAGWRELRAGNNAAAVAAFDRATDEDVAEDALYWSAVASERRKDLGGALRRYRQLVDRFPKSPRIDAANAAIARLSN